jgi:hydrogenase-4 membrane subunit HyfE
MNRNVLIFGILVIAAPIIFWVYYHNNLVCLPRASVSSFMFGIVPLLLFAIAHYRNIKGLMYVALSVLFAEGVMTPIIMLKRLGWEKFANERLLAFFTFEFFIIAQMVIILIALEQIILSHKEKP